MRFRLAVECRFRGKIIVPSDGNIMFPGTFPAFFMSAIVAKPKEILLGWERHELKAKPVGGLVQKAQGFRGAAYCASRTSSRILIKSASQRMNIGFSVGSGKNSASTLGRLVATTVLTSSAKMTMFSGR